MAEKEVNVLSKIFNKAKIKRLERKIKRLKKEEQHTRERFRLYYGFWADFMRFYNRFTNRKYDSDWPIQRMQEALDNLKELSP